MSVRIGLAAFLLLAAGCSSTQSATPPASSTTTTTASTEATAPPSSTTPLQAASADLFTEYAKVVGPLEPTLSTAQLREKYDGAVKMFCPGGRAKMVDLKNLGSNPPGVTGDKLAATNKKTATSIGALWEFGCGKGHDAELYMPLAAGKKWPCEPGYPNCTKAESDRYVSTLEFNECQKNPAKVWDTTTQTCKDK